MPDVNQYSVSPKEMAELIVKAAGLKEGKWYLTVGFAMTPGNFGPDLNAVIPGMVVGIQNLTIQREDPSSPAPANLSVDAAELYKRKMI
jgi:hypothetical protein